MQSARTQPLLGLGVCGALVVISSAAEAACRFRSLESETD
jgi:hypothetical protein